MPTGKLNRYFMKDVRGKGLKLYWVIVDRQTGNWVGHPGQHGPTKKECKRLNAQEAGYAGGFNRRYK